MLLPIEVLKISDQSRRIDPQESARRQAQLLDVLLHPWMADSGESVYEVFAHGVEATRLVMSGERNNWLVQLWDGGWVTQRAHDRTIEGLSKAYRDAAGLRQRPTTQEVNAKWPLQEGADALQRAFVTREDLAEFWYEAKVAVPNADEAAGDVPVAWALAFDVANTVFLRDGQPDLFWDADHSVRVLDALSGLLEAWGEPASADLDAPALTLSW